MKLNLDKTKQALKNCKYMFKKSATRSKISPEEQWRHGDEHSGFVR
jgi:hypothetical protein